MKSEEKTLQDRSARLRPSPASTDTEEVWVPGIAALAAIFLTGLLYLALPPGVIVGPNWLLLAIEAVFVVPLVVDALTAWDLPHAARRLLVLLPLGVSTLALVVGVVLFVLTLPADSHATNLLRSAAVLCGFPVPATGGREELGATFSRLSVRRLYRGNRAEPCRHVSAHQDGQGTHDV